MSCSSVVLVEGVFEKKKHKRICGQQPRYVGHGGQQMLVIFLYLEGVSISDISQAEIATSGNEELKDRFELAT